jgi:hypothetical protein
MIVRRSIKLGFAACHLVFFLALGCAEDNSKPECTDAQCYSQCAQDSWAGMTESYWLLEAHCVDGNQCGCSSGCDQERCDEYCIDEERALGGECQIGCSCFGAVSDAGPDASE